MQEEGANKRSTEYNNEEWKARGKRQVPNLWYYSTKNRQSL